VLAAFGFKKNELRSSI